MQQLELEEMQNGAMDRSGGIQQVSSPQVSLTSCARDESAVREKGSVTIRTETLAAHASASDIEPLTRDHPDWSG